MKDGGFFLLPSPGRVRSFTFRILLSTLQLPANQPSHRGERPDDPSSEYEERLSAQGACVYALEAVLGPEPQNPVQTASLSLADYLPQDLTDIGYVPHGMQGTVTNLRNRRIHEAERAARHS